MSEIVITEFMDETAIADLAAGFEVLFQPDLCDRREALEASVAEARAIIVRNRTRVDVALLDLAPRLEAVGRLGVGLDNIDVDACRARGVAVHPATGANTVAVAEYTIAAALLMVRGAFLSTESVLAGEWPRERLAGGEAQGRRLGLVGFGGIGRAVAERARALGFAVRAYDPLLAPEDPAWARSGVEPQDLDALIAGSDVITLHVPLTDGTRHLLDARTLALARPGAILVNTARGGVVDEAALADALREGRLGGAVLDVFENEPLAAGSVLAGVPNLVATPHVAGITAESNARVSALVAERVRETLDAG